MLNDFQEIHTALNEPDNLPDFMRHLLPPTPPGDWRLYRRNLEMSSLIHQAHTQKQQQNKTKKQTNKTSAGKEPRGQQLRVISTADGSQWMEEARA